MRLLRVLSVLLCCLIALPAGAADVTRVLAVLDLEPIENAVPLEEADTLTASVRGAVMLAATRVKLPVMTREVMAEMATPEMLKCGLNGCIATIGKQLQSRWVLGGRITRVDGRLNLTIEAYESLPGTLLGSKTFRAGDVSGLQDALEGTLTKEVRAWLELATGARKVVTSTTRQVRVRFESEPPGATVSVNGNLVCSATPCEESVPEGEQEVSFARKEYDTVVHSMTLNDKTGRVVEKLPPAFATLTVRTQPSGLPIKLDDRDLDSGGIESEHVLPGPHTVMVEHPCFMPVGERFTVSKGDTKMIKLTPEARLAALDVVVTDSGGSVLPARISVDGVAKDGTRFQLPVCAQAISVQTEFGAATVKLDKPLSAGVETALPVTIAGVALKAPDISRGEAGSKVLRFATRPEWVQSTPAPGAGNGLRINPARITWISSAALALASAAWAAGALFAPSSSGNQSNIVTAAGSTLLLGGLFAVSYPFDDEVLVERAGR